LLGSTAEAIREGQALVQNIPPTKTTNVSKLFQPHEKKQNLLLTKNSKTSNDIICMLESIICQIVTII